METIEIRKLVQSEKAWLWILPGKSLSNSKAPTMRKKGSTISGVLSISSLQYRGQFCQRINCTVLLLSGMNFFVFPHRFRRHMDSLRTQR